MKDFTPYPEIPVSKEIYARAHRLADLIWKKRGAIVGKSEKSDNFKEGEEDLYRTLLGLLGEFGWSEFSGQPMEWEGRLKHDDDGIDFAGGREVKCSDHDWPNLIINAKQEEELISGKEGKKIPKLYVLAKWDKDKKTVTLLGQVSRELFVTHRQWREKGEKWPASCWFFDRTKLTSVEKPPKCDLRERWGTDGKKVPQGDYSSRPYPKPKPGNCLACESMGGWKPYTNISMYCFYSAKVLKVARPPVICTEAVVNCPLIIENLI